MLSILSEVTTEPPGMAFMAGIAAGMVIIVKGIEFLSGRLRKNGNGCGRPGYSHACVKHLERLKGVETQTISIGETLKELRTDVKDLGKDVQGLGGEVQGLRGELKARRGD